MTVISKLPEKNGPTLLAYQLMQMSTLRAARTVFMKRYDQIVWVNVLDS